MDVSNVVLETERLRLVPGTVDFTEQIFMEYREPVIKYMNYGPPESLEILQKNIQDINKDMEEGNQLFMAILLKDTGEFIGCMAIEDLKENIPEMGGWLKESSHGHGYGREAASALKNWADEHLEYQNILWPCAVENKASCKLAETLGGKIHKKYQKKTHRGKTLEFYDYLISK